MIRYFYRLLDFIGSVFALLSPLSIIHWLVEATQEKTLVGLVQWLDPFFHPLDGVFEPLFKSIFNATISPLISPLMAMLDNVATGYGQPDLIAHELAYDITIGSTGQTIPITQGLLGLVFTILFFVCSFGSQMLRSLEQRLDVNKQDVIQRRRLQQLQTEQKKKDSRAVSNKNIMVTVSCEFQRNNNTAGCFEQLHQRHNGQVREMMPDSMGFEFSSIDQALQFCIETTQGIIKYYASLRPVDPQPPFRMAIHTHDKDDTPETTIRYCKSLAHYAAENQAIVSEHIKSMLDATGQSQKYTLSPIGAYYLEGIGAQELYRLVIR